VQIATPSDGGKAVFLVDGTGLVYRAHFAFVANPLKTSDGRDIGALYGFANTIINLVREQGARRMIVAFDTKGPTFRHEAYEGYKATRPSAPPEIRAQEPDVKRFLDEAGILRLEEPGIEADDIIGSLAKKLAAAGEQVVMVTSDKDMMQIVGPSIRQFIPARGKEPARWFGPSEVEEKWGVPPERFRDLLALTGDASDNVPGVRGVGPKTAAELLERFSDLDDIYRRMDEVPGASLRKKLLDNKESAFLSRDLVTLRLDLDPLAEGADLAVPDLPARPGLTEFLREFEFRRLEALLGPPPAAAAKRLPAVREAGAADLERVVARDGVTAISLACLASGTPPLDLDLKGLVFVIEGEAPLFVRVGAGGVPAREVARLLGPLLSNERCVKIGHDLKRDVHALRSAGIALTPPFFDTRVASYVLDPSRRHDLTALSQEFLGRSLGGPPDRKESGDLFADPAVTGQEAAAAGERVLAAWDLRPVLEANCRERHQADLLHEMELPLIDVLASMERAGVTVDAAHLERMKGDLDVDLRRLEEKAHREAGRPFNLNSPPQLREILFDVLKLPRKKKTKTGYSTDSGVLESIADLHPLPATLLEYRQLSKLQSTYVEVLPKLIHPETGRIHATFHQTVAATGRLSSSDPNLQNIPVRSEAGRRIRRAIIAAPEPWLFLSADYSQIELRLLAHLSGDEYLLQAFRNGEDIHTATACRVFDVAPGVVDGGLRAKAKVANYGIIYGMGPSRLAVEMGIAVKEARAFIDEYLEKLPGVRGYIERGVEEARSRGFVETLAGRRRYLPDLTSRDPRWRSQAERMAINTPIQGSAADLIKRAMVRIHELFSSRGLASRIVAQIHDELLIEGAPDERGEVETVVRSEMESAASLDVPLVVDLGWGRTWWDAHG